MVLLGFTLGLLEIIFFSGFLLLLLVGISFDRQGREDPKWYIFGLGLIVIAGWFWKDWTFSSLFDTISTLEFWKPVFAYLAAGVVYSMVEFVLNIRRSAKTYKAAWGDALTQTITIVRDSDNGRKKESLSLKELLDKVSFGGEDFEANNAAKETVKRFVERHTNRNAIVGLNFVDGSPEPRINKIQLSEHLGAWTFFWPLYAVSLVLGDLLTEIFDQLSEFFVNLSGRFVRMSFKDVFKF